MPVRLNAEDNFAQRMAKADRAQFGIWICSANSTVAEIVASSGIDWILIDAEHTPNDLQSILVQLQVTYGHPATPMVRPPHGDSNLIKQYLDLGVQNILIPMVNTAAEAAALVRAVRYPPLGIRGVGSALARASRWNRIGDYLPSASDTISLFVQIETTEAVANIESILAVEGIDGLFIGPSDLAASMGLLGQQDHEDVVSSVEACIKVAKSAGIKVGVNAFAPATADRYIAAGVDFILVGADVALLARGSEALADRFISKAPKETRTSY